VERPTRELEHVHAHLQHRGREQYIDRPEVAGTDRLVPGGLVGLAQLGEHAHPGGAVLLDGEAAFEVGQRLGDLPAVHPAGELGDRRASALHERVLPAEPVRDVVVGQAAHAGELPRAGEVVDDREAGVGRLAVRVEEQLAVLQQRGHDADLDGGQSLSGGQDAAVATSRLLGRGRLAPGEEAVTDVEQRRREHRQSAGEDPVGPGLWRGAPWRSKRTSTGRTAAPPFSRVHSRSTTVS